jgi:hypothetical protein
VRLDRRSVIAEHPISAYQLNDWLRQLCLQPGRDRSTALSQLAADLPAALLARMLGINITVPVAPTACQQRRLDRLRRRRQPPGSPGPDSRTPATRPR